MPNMHMDVNQMSRMIPPHMLQMMGGAFTMLPAVSDSARCCVLSRLCGWGCAHSKRALDCIDGVHMLADSQSKKIAVLRTCFDKRLLMPVQGQRHCRT